MDGVDRGLLQRKGNLYAVFVDSGLGQLNYPSVFDLAGC